MNAAAYWQALAVGELRARRADLRLGAVRPPAGKNDQGPVGLDREHVWDRLTARLRGVSR